MGALQLTYEPKFKIVHRTGEPMRSHEAKSVQLWLSVDPLAESGSDVGAYVYCFNNPINLTDPDGRWPDMPSWKDIKKSYNDAKSSAVKTYNQTKASVTRNYNEAKSTIASNYSEAKTSVTKNYNIAKQNAIQAKEDVVKVTTQTLKNTQKWTKDHKEQLLAGAKILQDKGDDLATAGLVAAAVGAPIAGVGAAPDLKVAGWGGILSTVGTVVEIGVKIITEDDKAMGDIGDYVATEVITAGVGKILPGTKGHKKEIKGAIRATNEIIKNEVGNQVGSIIEEARK